MPIAIVVAAPVALSAAMLPGAVPAGSAAHAWVAPPAAMAPDVARARGVPALAAATIDAAVTAPGSAAGAPAVAAPVTATTTPATIAPATASPATASPAPAMAPDKTAATAPATPPAQTVAAGGAAPVTPPVDGAGAAAGPADAGDAGVVAPVVHDPWEKTNRAIFRFNHTADRIVIHPAAVVWKTVLPRFVRVHIGNGLANLDEPVTTINDILQIHFGRAGRSLARFVVNSTFGLAGLFDIATRDGLPAHPADFGQTLGRWGVHTGPYVVFPLFGPSDLRDGVGLVADRFMDPPSYVLGGITSNFGIARFGAEILTFRAEADGTVAAIYEAQDPYAFARSAYMQRRFAVVLDATGQTAALPDFDSPGGS